MIQNNIIKAASENQVEKLIFLGSSCIYPKEAEQPIKENSLLSKPLEKTNEGYAIAKIAGLKLCSYMFKEHKKDFITVMPTNLYGPNDNFDLSTSHVLVFKFSRFFRTLHLCLPLLLLSTPSSPLSCHSNPLSPLPYLLLTPILLTPILLTPILLLFFTHPLFRTRGQGCASQVPQHDGRKVQGLV